LWSNYETVNCNLNLHHPPPGKGSALSVDVGVCMADPNLFNLTSLSRETMKNKTKFKLSISICTILFSLILLNCSGCSSKVYHRTELKDGIVVAEVKIVSNTCLMWTQAQNIKAESIDKDGATRSMAVGNFEQVTDAESIEAVTDGVVDIASGGTTKVAEDILN